MEPRQTELITASWNRIEAGGTELAEAFYGRLFQLDPRVEDLFAAAEMESQHGKFVAMLGEVVRLVRDPERFAALLADSGRRHAGYGVVARHYRVVGEALLWAMDHALDGGLDPDTRQAWAEAYTRMAFLMQQAHTQPPRMESPKG